MKEFFKMMLASLTGFVVAIGLLFFVFFLIILSAISSGSKQGVVKEKSVLEIKLGAEIPERTVKSGFGNSSEALEQGVGLSTIVSALKKAKADNKIKCVLLRPDLYSDGLSTAEDIRNAILDFRKSGKPVISYSEVLTEKGYFIASACDKVYVNPKGMLEFKGYASQIMMYKGMLDKVGVKMQVFKVGKYKSAVEPYIQEQLSEPNKEQIRNFLWDLNRISFDKISQTRKIDTATLMKIANDFVSNNLQSYLDNKLIDGLKIENEVEEELKKQSGIEAKDKIRKIGVAAYYEKNEGSKSGDKIAVIYCTGEINSGKNETGDGIGSETIVTAIKKARLDKNVKGIVLRVNSPGGSALASDVIAAEVELAKKTMPVVVSFGDVAASGGYYISCLADSIFANTNSITGSIGVFALIPDVSQLYKEKMGLGFETVKTGKYSDIGRPDRPLNVGEASYFQKMVNEIYIDFISIVAKGRKMDTAQVNQLAQGHVYSAIDAKELNLIDGFGGLDRAVASVAYKAKLKEFQTVEYPRLKSPWEMFFGNGQSGQDLYSQFLKNELGFIYPAFKEVKAVIESKGVYMRMPYDLLIY